MVQDSPSYLQAEDKTDGLKGKVPWVLSKRHCFSCLGRYLAYAENTKVERNTVLSWGYVISSFL